MSQAASSVVLIGPVRAGKSTLGKLLAERLRLPQISLDQIRWKYYREIGYGENLARELRQKGGFLALVLYWNLFEAHAVERMLSEHPQGIFDFGAGIYESSESFTRVQRALAPYQNVILLLPLSDREETLAILRARDVNPPNDLNFDFNRHFLEHHTYYDLAKLTVYTAGRTPTETCDEILALLGGV